MFVDTTGRPTGHAIHALAQALTGRIKSRLRRRQFKTLLDLDDHMLNDIGVTRSEVETAANLPLPVNAAIELRRMSLARRRAGVTLAGHVLHNRK